MTPVNESKPRRINADRVRNSRAYRSALKLAGTLADKPERLTKLAGSALKKAKSLDQGPIAEIKDGLLALFRLLKAYASGAYRKISWSNLLLVIAAVVYFVTPIDLIPDFIAMFGFIDDAAILSWTLKAIGTELKAFRDWEQSNNAIETNEAEE